jgi:hypothetical protein
MATNYFDIERALVVAAKAVDAVTPMGNPNDPLENPGPGLWIQLHNLRIESTPVSLGDFGEDNHPGILQIDINYPQNKGAGIPLQKADEFASYFKAGLRIESNGQHVTVLSSSLSPARYVGGYYRISVDVHYYSRTTRN